MKTMKVWMMAAGTMAILMLSEGCALFLVGAAAGAGAGTVSYCGNELRVSQAVTVDRAWVAANAAMKDMDFTIIPAETHKDATGGRVQGRNAKDQVVRIEVMHQTDQITDLRVRVGTFNTPDNRSTAQMLYEKLNKRLAL